ncbi:hypothetical protein PGB90_005303 [Kerria lacca]
MYKIYVPKIKLNNRTVLLWLSLFKYKRIVRCKHFSTSSDMSKKYCIRFSLLYHDYRTWKKSLYILLTILKNFKKYIFTTVFSYDILHLFQGNEVKQSLKLFFATTLIQSIYSFNKIFHEKVTVQTNTSANFNLKNNFTRSTLITYFKNLNYGAWNLKNMVEEYINSDDLLDETDLKKPNRSSFTVCETTGKRKACKDCTCGLAREFDIEKKQNDSLMKTSCGNCYLGDAFRCTSCPYLGMPAFKPGEKIQLDEQFLSSDI